MVLMIIESIFLGMEESTCYMKLPVTPGHEFSGRVVELGEGAKDHHKVDVGDLVVSEQIITCNKCRFCCQGQYQVKYIVENYRLFSRRTIHHANPW